MAKGFCQLCGQEIVGNGETYHHKQWPRKMTLHICRSCDRSKPRCRECGLPMASGTNNGMCKTCSESLRICLSCGNPIDNKYFEFDGIGPYCQACYKEKPPCDVCTAPLTIKQWRLSDGRVMCANCHATAIYSKDAATLLFEEMKTIISRDLGFTLNVPTGLALVDRNQLADVISKQQETSKAGGSGTGELDAKRTLGLYARRGIRRGIYIQTGLPRLLFLQVAAHEFAHAWQGENCPLLRNVLVHEGFAEWVAYRVLGKYGYKRGQDNMLARDDIYGRGLKWTLNLETEQGTAGVIEACRRITD